MPERASKTRPASGRVHAVEPAESHPREGLLKVIAVFKLVKSLLLIGLGLGALDLLNPRAAAHAELWASAVAWRLGPRAALTAESRLSHLGSSRLTLVAIIALLYASLFAVEGVGLWRARRWAEYLTIFATASFVPFEAYELVRHATWPRVATLVVNMLVLAYLIWKVRQRDD